MSKTEQVRKALMEVVDPCSAATGSNLNIVEMGLVKSIDVSEGHAHVEMRLTTPSCHMGPYFMNEAQERVGELSGIESVTLDTDNGFEWTEEMMSEEAQQRRQAVFDEHEKRYRQETATN